MGERQKAEDKLENTGKAEKAPDPLNHPLKSPGSLHLFPVATVTHYHRLDGLHPIHTAGGQNSEPNCGQGRAPPLEAPGENPGFHSWGSVKTVFKTSVLTQPFPLGAVAMD